MLRKIDRHNFKGTSFKLIIVNQGMKGRNMKILQALELTFVNVDQGELIEHDVFTLHFDAAFEAKRGLKLVYELNFDG